jgi:hypothetical protein
MVGAGEEVRCASEVTCVANAEFFENFFVVVAKRGRRRVDARAAVRKGKRSERHAETAINSVAACVVMDNSATLELRIGNRLAHGTHVRRRYVARLQKGLPFIRGANKHDLAQHLRLTRSVGVALLIGLLDHVGSLKQNPQPALLP